MLFLRDSGPAIWVQFMSPRRVEAHNINKYTYISYIHKYVYLILLNKQQQQHISHTAAKQQLSEAGTTIKQSDMEIKHCTTKLRSKQGELKSNDTNYARDKKAFDNGENEIKKLQANLGRIDYQEGLLEEMEEQRRILQQQRREMQHQLDRKNGHRFEFQYRDPEPNFDRRRVRGMVCMLFDVRDNRDSMALSMCAGGSVSTSGLKPLINDILNTI